MSGYLTQACWFFGRMLKKLEANKHKLHWDNSSKDELLGMLIEEVCELEKAKTAIQIQTNALTLQTLQ